MIRILNLSRLCLRKITEELETERWYDTMWSEGVDDCVCIELNENVIFKTWGEEFMIDLGGQKSFFYSDDFERIVIS